MLTEEGRATGVEAVWQPPDGRGAQVTVKAPRVVVACGSLESPALLLRSGIGGPAVGHNLRLHPSSVVGGAYGTDQEAWWGAPQAGLCDEFADTGEGYGFLIETAQYAPGLIGSATPWISAADHKQRMEEFRFTGDVHLADARSGRRPGDARRERRGGADVLGHRSARPREPEEGDRGAGPPARGRRRPPDRPARRGGADLAAGRRPRGLHRRVSSGSRSAPAATSSSAPTRWAPAAWARIPQTSVAGPWGELHDTKGVWIGDGSAFPTSSGTNPMVSIMALAHRTAEAIAEDAGARLRTASG